MKKKKSTGGLTVDFGGVEDRVLVPEGDYRVKVESVEQKESQAGNPMLLWVFKINEPKNKQANGQKLYTNTVLAPQSLWVLRNLLKALGIKVPNSAMELELEDYVGLECVVSVEHEKYEGRDRAKVVNFSSIEDEDEEEEDVEVEDDGDEEEEEEDEDSGEDSEEDEDDEEEAEELEAVSADEVEEMSSKQLAKLIKDYDLDVDLDSIKSNRKKIAAVVEALEEKDLLAK